MSLMKMIKKAMLPLLVISVIFLGCSKNTPQTEIGDEENTEELKGSWHGTIDVPGQPLPIQVAFEDEDNLTGMISIPIQGISDYPLSKVKLDGHHVLFTIDLQGELVTFDGDLVDEQMEGTFKQHGQTFPFKLEKGELASNDDEDEGDFLTVKTEQGTIYGQLEVPEQDSDEPYPVLIIIPGSGPTDRNGNTLAGDNNSLRFLAEKLAEHGIASIRYDKPGAGKNANVTVPEEDMTFDQFVDNAVAWVEMVKNDNRFSDIGIIGHSQGSLEGILAAQQTDIDVFISLAGGGSSIDKILYGQLEEQLPEELLKESKDIIHQLKKGNPVEQMSPALEELFRPSVQPFMMSWMEYTPAEEIKKLSMPILIVNGTRDLQTSENEGKLLHEANDMSEFLLIENMNHVLKESPEDREGNLKTYANPELPLADGLMDGIAEFLGEADFIQE